MIIELNFHKQTYEIFPNTEKGMTVVDGEYVKHFFQTAKIPTIEEINRINFDNCYFFKL